MIREKLQGWADYFGAVALALWVATAILYMLKNQSNETLLALAGVGVLFFALFLFFKFTAVRSAMTSRAARYGSNALLISVAFIGSVALLNFMGTRYHYRFDTTENQNFTLSPLTIQVLRGLKEPVRAVAFYTAMSDPQARQDIEGRLREYAQVSDKFTYKFIDPQAEPQIAMDYKVQFDQTIVFERGKRRENVFQTDEQSLTNALNKVSQDTQPTIYFTTGHGEHSPEDSSQNGFSMLKDPLEQDNYKVQVLDLKTVTDTLPADLNVLVIAGPRQPFDTQEVQRVRDYVSQGGRVFVMLDALTESGLEGFLKELGITARNDLVIDPRFGLFGQAQVPVINSYRSHAVTQDLTGQSTFFPLSRSLTSDPAASSITYTLTALFTTSDLSWGETDADSIKNQSAKFDESKDAKGPLNLAYAVESKGDKPARIVVLGNSTFISNGTLQARVQTSSGQAVPIQSGNGILFVNAIHWLAGQENLIAIPPKAASQHSIYLTGEQSNFVLFSSFLLLPGVILIIGALVWWRRR